MFACLENTAIQLDFEILTHDLLDCLTVFIFDTDKEVLWQTVWRPRWNAA